jgi:hypothetical protein
LFRVRLTFLLTLLLLVSTVQAHEGSATATDGYLRSPRLGITHISLTGEPTSDERYRNALELGAGWNRYPIYWDRVETQPGTFDWAAYDQQVTSDLSYGFSINAILLGRPGFFADGKNNERIAGLQEPIFADGSDFPEPEKAINPDNPWANFVMQTVARYKPGGVLALQEDWPANQGIRVWEVWNEPDFELFWSGSIEDYARLLKVAYIVAKNVDPNAQMMFGGLLFQTQDNWLARVLAIFEDDPLVEKFNWYHDIVAVHSYSYPWRSGWLVLWVRQTLKAYGLERPIWLNESGVPVWDDYPGPRWASQPEEWELRATAEQQASFFIQSTVYAWSEGADVVFFHQLYDDCGNQPAGTDFPFSTVEQCPPGQICAGDAFGLFRNASSSICFSQHPQPNTPRPAASAYRLIADLFGNGDFDQPELETLEDALIFTFHSVRPGQRVRVLWNRTFEPVTVDVELANAAKLYSLTDVKTVRPDAEGVYRLTLPPAQPDYYPFLEPGDVSAVGGEPFILVEATRHSSPLPLPTVYAPLPTQEP